MGVCNVQAGRLVAQAEDVIKAHILIRKRSRLAVRIGRTLNRRHTLFIRKDGRAKPSGRLADFPLGSLLIERKNLAVPRIFFHIGKHRNEDVIHIVPKPAVVAISPRHSERRVSRQRVVGVVIVLQSKSKLLYLISALHTARGLARSLNGRKKKTDQNTDDRDNDQQFYEGKAVIIPPPVITGRFDICYSLFKNIVVNYKR